MADLTAPNVNYQILGDPAAGTFISYPMDDGESIQMNAIVQLKSGLAQPADNSGPVVGIALFTRESATGDETQEVVVQAHHVMVFPLSGVSLSNYMAAVYASDDHTLTLTPNTSFVGHILGVHSPGFAIVRVDCGIGAGS
jgi:hypothetical protein